MNLNWKNESRVDHYSKKLSQRVMDFEEAVNEVMEKTTQIEDYLTQLGTCELQKEELATKLDYI